MWLCGTSHHDEFRQEGPSDAENLPILQNQTSQVLPSAHTSLQEALWDAYSQFLLLGDDPAPIYPNHQPGPPGLSTQITHQGALWGLSTLICRQGALRGLSTQIGHQEALRGLST